MLDLEKVSNICLEHKALFHSDTVQSVGHYKMDLSKTKVDFIVASAHKFHGPKGIGFAYINKSSSLRPLIFGGMQERGYRAGTESVHNIVGMSEALNISMGKLEEETKYISELKSYFIKKLKFSIKDVEFNGLSGDMNKSTYTLFCSGTYYEILHQPYVFIRLCYYGSILPSISLSFLPYHSPPSFYGFHLFECYLSICRGSCCLKNSEHRSVHSTSHCFSQLHELF